jgi:hypothetical protein
MEFLKAKDLYELHEETHISQQNLKFLLDHSFVNIGKVQFVGFVAILEHTYKIDLSELKAEGLAFYEESKSNEKELFVHIPKDNNKNIIIVVTSALIAVLLLIIFILYNGTLFQQSGQDEIINNSEINQALEKIDEKKSEVLSPIAEMNTTEVIEDAKPIVEEVKSPIVEEKKTVESKTAANMQSSIKLIPRSDVWLGVIDAKTFQKINNSVISKPYALDTSKDLLIVLGHGHIAVEDTNITTEYKEGNRMRFYLKDSKIEKIDLEKFKELNQGKVW